MSAQCRGEAPHRHGGPAPGHNKIATTLQPPSLTLVSGARVIPAQAKMRKPPERGPAMYLHYQLMKARQDKLLRAAARHRLAADPAGPHPRPHHPMAAAARCLAAMRCPRLFS